MDPSTCQRTLPPKLLEKGSPLPSHLLEYHQLLPSLWKIKRAFDSSWTKKSIVRNYDESSVLELFLSLSLSSDYRSTENYECLRSHTEYFGGHCVDEIAKQLIEKEREKERGWKIKEFWRRIFRDVWTSNASSRIRKCFEMIEV